MTARHWFPLARHGALAALVAGTMVGGCGTSAPLPSATGDAGIESPATASATGTVRLERGAHPLARSEYDTGRLDPARVLHNLSLVFKLSPAQKADRDALLAEIERPGSPSYHKWLTPEQYAARFGAQPADVARASTWLASQGLTVHEPSRLGARVTFSGTVAQIESAFETEMHTYAVGGERHYAMARAPSVPASLADRVLAVFNTHDFNPTHSKPQMRVVSPDATCPGGDPYCNGNGIAPPDWSFIYDVGPLYNPGIGGTKLSGAGVTVMIVGITDIAQSDLTAFRTRYGLAANNITKTVVPNTGAAVGGNGAGIEAVLDTEWAGGIAPGATIRYVYTGGSDPNVTDAVYYAIEQNYGGILSESWGGCEQGSTTADADVLEVYGTAASLQGISYLASSGDAGAASCQGKGGLWVNLPAAFPGVTSVGGTGFARPAGLTFTGGTVSARGTEATWNESNNAYTGSVGAGGGGISSVFSRPLYQSAIPTCTPVGTLPSSVVAANQRQVPDVSFTAASGGTQYGIFIECTIAGQDCSAAGGNPVVVEIGGTSASTPSFAGVVALANQATGSRLGNINPLLYALNQTTPTAFHDITTGNNEVICRAADPGCPGNNVLYGYAAKAGYDCATGLGSLDATNVVKAIYALTPTATTLGAAPTATTEGGSVTLDATVDVQGTNANALGGDVTFVFQSYLTNGELDLSWTLGEVAITNGTTTSGTASLTTAIPPGMVRPGQAVDVYAMYGGDANHLGSISAKQNITFAPVYLCITPPTTSVAAGATINYTAAGGVAPVRWYVDYDSTGNASTGAGYSTLNVTTGVFKAGTSQPGYVIVVAVDADGAETFSEVTVAGGSGTVPWSASGPANYAGIVVSASPLTTCSGGQNCGTIPNGCGGTVSCGNCMAPQTCGGAGVAGQCGCTSNGTCTGGQTCGTGPDNCGNTITCGTCIAPQTCGGAGVAGQCGCTSNGTCAGGQTCGTGADNCGNTITCGTCIAPQTCGGAGVAGQCGCTSNGTCAGGQTCGTGPDNCGNTITCGTCIAPQTCGGAGVTGQCGCTSTGTCAGGQTCGTGADNCGNTITCGTCTGGAVCSGNVCVTMDAGSGVDSGTADSGGGTDSGTDGSATDSGTLTDASAHDSGAGDSGGTKDSGAHDSGATADSGSAGKDSGTASDGGAALPDGSSAEDSGLEQDSAADTDGSVDASSAPGVSQGGGCGCKTAGGASGSGAQLASMGALALLVGARARRRRRTS